MQNKKESTFIFFAFSHWYFIVGVYPNNFYMSYFVYILECHDHTLYTWYTDNVEKRIKTHNEWKWAKYTRGRIPVILLYKEEFETKTEALKREREIKKMTKKQKLFLIWK